MCQEQYNTKNKKFKQLTYKDRVKIETLYNDQHLNYTEIGEILGKQRTTISRDIKQGLVKNLTTDLIEIYVYSAEVAQKKNEENETAKGTNLKIGNDMRLAEFRNWETIEKSYTGSKKKRTSQYFADAYCSWQRGTNENINKMIRRFLPKGTSFKRLKKEDLKIKFNNFGDFTNFSITNEEDAQEIAKYVDDDKLSPYCFSCNNIIQSFIVELFEIATTENIEIKRCKNCGKYFVPDSRSNEIYCSNIYENGKTCKEVGHFRTQQRLMKADDDLRIYRNVYQKLLLRTRRNPDNSQYEKECQQFKEKNLELKEKINNGEITQEEYMKWLNKQ